MPDDQGRMQFMGDDEEGAPSRPARQPEPAAELEPLNREIPAAAPPPRARVVIRRGPFSSLATWIILAFAFLTAIVLDAFFSDSGMMQVWNLEREYKQLIRDRDALKQSNEALSLRIGRLEKDPAAVESSAREDLNYAKPGEDVFVFPEPSPPPQK